MIIKLPDVTKERLLKINAEIIRLNTMIQSSLETVCEANGYSGEFKVTDDFDIDVQDKNDQ